MWLFTVEKKATSRQQTKNLKSKALPQRKDNKSSDQEAAREKKSRKNRKQEKETITRNCFFFKNAIKFANI